MQVKRFLAKRDKTKIQGENLLKWTFCKQRESAESLQRHQKKERIPHEINEKGMLITLTCFNCLFFFRGSRRKILTGNPFSHKTPFLFVVAVHDDDRRSGH